MTLGKEHAPSDGVHLLRLLHELGAEGLLVKEKVLIEYYSSAKV